MAYDNIKALADAFGYDLSGYSEDLLGVLDREASVGSAREALHAPLSRADLSGLERMAMEDVLSELVRPAEEFGSEGRGFPHLSVAVADVVRDMADAAAQAMDPFADESETTFVVASVPGISPSDVAQIVMASVRLDLEAPDQVEVEPGTPSLGNPGILETVGKVAAVATLGPIGLLAPKVVEKVKEVGPKVIDEIAEAAPEIAEKIAAIAPALAFGPLALAPPEVLRDAMQRFATGRPSPDVEGLLGRAASNVVGAKGEVSEQISEYAVGAVRELFAPPAPKAEGFPALPILVAGGALILLVLATR
jgi:hypothetical protein